MVHDGDGRAGDHGVGAAVGVDGVGAHLVGAVRGGHGDGVAVVVAVAVGGPDVGAWRAGDGGSGKESVDVEVHTDGVVGVGVERPTGEVDGIGGGARAVDHTHR